ncbi:MAG: hypothetical protein KAS32_11905 [Candidatus Peribacteraceae bacterium]|nr:hypothetical protein [Candidatus Peribacteraceae bacterium]
MAHLITKKNEQYKLTLEITQTEAEALRALIYRGLKTGSTIHTDLRNLSNLLHDNAVSSRKDKYNFTTIAMPSC